MRKTNKDKWNEFKKIVEKRESDFIATEIKDYPEVLYRVVPSGNIEAWDVVHIGYFNKLYQRDKPSNGDVKKIQLHVEENEPLIYSNIRICLEQKGPKYKSSCSEFINDVGIKYCKSLTEAKARSQAFNEKRAEEKALIDKGYIRCAYCNKVVSPDDAVERKLFYRSGGQSKSVMNKYCPGNCGGHDQMAHEG